MKYAGKTFTLYASQPVAIQGSDSLYTYQNTGTGTATIVGSNNAVNWTSVATVVSGASYTGSHAYAFLMMTGSTEVSVSRGAAGDNSFSASNPLPVAQTDGLSVSGTVIGTAANQATSGIATVLFTTSMLNYESITVQVTSAGTGCTITYETSDDNSNWVSIGGLNANAVGTLIISTTSSTATLMQFSRKGLYFRARVSTYGLGTVTVIGTLSKVAVVNTLPAIYSVHTEGNTVSSGTVGITVEGRTSSKTLVSNAQFVRPIATLDGRQIVRLDSIPENEWQYAAASGGIVNTADNVLIAAAGANIKNYLTGLSVANANATASEIVIKDGASTVIWRMYLAANAPIKSIIFSTPLQSTANTALNVACITTGTQTYISAQGYKAP